MSKITLSSVGSLVDATTAATTINSNFAAIAAAFENTFSRDGTSPNTMSASLDMNSNRILNLPLPLNDAEPARRIDLLNAAIGDLSSLVPTIASNNIWTGFNTFKANSGVVQLGMLNPNTVLFVDGSGATPVTAISKPTVLISRYENVVAGGDGSGGPGLLVTNVGTGTTQNVAVVGYSYSLGNADTVGLYGTAVKQAGTGAAFGLFAIATQVGTSSTGIGANIAVGNLTGRNFPYASNLIGVQGSIGIDLSYGSNAVKKGTVGLLLRGDHNFAGAAWDVGIGFNRFGGVTPTVTADIQTDSDATSILLANSGSHVNGLDLTGATFSGAPIYLPNATSINWKNSGGLAVPVIILDGSNNIRIGNTGFSGIVAFGGHITPLVGTASIGTTGSRWTTAFIDTLTLTNALGAANGGFGVSVSASSGVPLFAAGVPTFTSTSGTGNFVRVTSPTLVTPILGVATATSINGNTFTTGTYTLTGVAGKTLTFNNSLTLAGTDATIQTFPATSGTVVTSVTTAGGDLTGSYPSPTVTANAITNAKMATMAAKTLKANATAGSAVPTDVTAAVARTNSLLNIDQLTTNGDSNYTILSTDRTVGTSAALTASRTWTLPAASSINAGQQIKVIDLAGGVTATNTIVITRSGSDTINGVTSITMTGTNGGYEFVSDGTSKWSAQGFNGVAGGPVITFNSRAGAVVPASADYTAAQIGSTGVFYKVNIQKFTASGTYTPSTGLVYAIIECQGAGAGGGGTVGNAAGLGFGGGGGAGSYSRKVASAATIGASQAVTIGAGGAGGAIGANSGSAGGDTSVGALCIGKGAPSTANANGGAGSGGGTGGVAGTGDVTTIGATGGVGGANTTTNQAGVGSIGASSGFGGGGAAGNILSGNTSTGATATGFGAGGAGGLSYGSATGAAGGAGSGGLAIITEFLNQ